ncbi:MAG: hypothetical protein PHQ23_11795 [Candidatus Wallbacteria bacterium]|nr:hypothetical protein [Candidatus Wallbacteria bacterium]
MWEKLMSVKGSKFEEKGDNLVKNGNTKQARLEYLKAQEIYRLHQIEKPDLEEKIAILDKNLRTEHEKSADQLELDGELSAALNELEFLLYLEKDENRKNSIIDRIDALQEKLDNKQSDEAAQRFFESGNRLLGEGCTAEAIVEFKEALRFERISLELRSEITGKVKALEAEFADIYLTQARKYVAHGKQALALAEFEKALSFLEFNEETRKKVIKEMEKQQPAGEGEDISDEEWNEAYGSFRESLNSFLGFDYRPAANVVPCLMNPNWENYLRARNRLGGLYLRKAEKNRDSGKLHLALKLFHEAASYFDPADECSREIKRSIKELKNKIG